MNLVERVLSCRLLSAGGVLMLTGAAFGAAGTFSGTGRYLDPDNWSGKVLPGVKDNANGFITGYAVATNEQVTLEGCQWMHIGNTYDSGLGVLDLYNSDYKTATLRIGCNVNKKADNCGGLYHQKGGTFTGGGTVIGWGENSTSHKSAQMVLEGVTASMNSLTIGGLVSADGLKTDDRLVVDGGSFSTASLSVGGGNQGLAVFTNTTVSVSANDMPVINGKTADSAEMFVANSTWLSQGEQFTIAGAADSYGKAVFVNCPSVTLYKPRLGNGVNAQGGLYVTNSTVRNTWQVFAGNASGAKGVVDLYDSSWENKSGPIQVGSAVGGSGYFALHGAKSAYNDSGKGVYVGNASGAYGEMFFDGLLWENISCTVFPGSANGGKGRVIFKDISETIGLLKKTGQVAGGDGTIEYRNCRVTAAATSFGTQKNTGLSIVLNDSRLDWNFSGDNLWFLNQEGMWSGFHVTNSTMVIDGANKSVQHTKANARLVFAFKDSFVAIATNATFSTATSASGSGVFTFDGDKGRVVFGKFGLGAGENTVNFLGGEVAVSEISPNKSGVQNLNFNGGTLKARASKTSGDGWVANGDFMNARVLEGGATFDTAGFNCWFWPVLKHGGAAEKDGGIVKKGAGSLFVKQLPTMTGDIVVEEGTLDLSAENGYTMTAGQMIGGAGTLKVGSGFVAGGVRYDAAQANGLTVDGAVAFAPGSSVQMTGTLDEARKVTLLTATSLTGVENLTVTDLPKKWKVFVRDNTLQAGRSSGMLLIFR